MISVKKKNLYPISVLTLILVHAKDGLFYFAVLCLNKLITILYSISSFRKYPPALLFARGIKASGFLQHSFACAYMLLEDYVPSPDSLQLRPSNRIVQADSPTEPDPPVLQAIVVFFLGKNVKKKRDAYFCQLILIIRYVMIGGWTAPWVFVVVFIYISSIKFARMNRDYSFSFENKHFFRLSDEAIYCICTLYIWEKIAARCASIAVLLSCHAIFLQDRSFISSIC